MIMAKRKFEVEVPNDFSGRFLMLSHEDIQIISNALNYTYLKKIDMLGEMNKHRPLFSETARNEILKSANKYGDLEGAISKGEKDV